MRDQELVGLVWEAAAALNPREYSLLDLHLRKELSADELAANLGLRRDNVYMMLSRLRDSLEEAVVCLLLMRRGRRDCAELDALLATRRAELTRDTRKAIRKHLDGCTTCQEQRKRFASPAEIFAGIAVVPVAVEVKGAVWRDITARIDAFEAGPGPGFSGDAGPASWWRPTRNWIRAGAIAFGAVLVLLAIAVLRPVPWLTSTSERLEAPAADSIQQPVAGVAVRPPALAAEQAQTVPVLAPAAGADRLGEPAVEQPDPARIDDAQGAAAPPRLQGVATLSPTRTVAPTATNPPGTPGPGLTAPDAEPTAPTGPADVPTTATPPATRPAPTPSPTPAGGSDPVPTSAPPSVVTVEQATATPNPVEPTPTRSAPTPAAPPTATPTTPPTTATMVPTSAPTRTATPMPCPPLANPRLAATPNSANPNDVTLTWRSTGGCAPFSGSIQARYQQERGAYATHPISRGSGTLTDQPPIRPEGTYTIVYTLSLQVGGGATVSDSATATVRWIG